MLYFIVYLLGFITAILLFPQEKITIEKIKAKNHSEIKDLTIEPNQKGGFLRRVFGRKKQQQKEPS